MKVFIRFKLMHSSSIQKRQSTNRILNFSTISKPSRILQTRKNQQNLRKAEAETSSFASLFNEITTILGGADTLTPDKSSSAVLISNKNHKVISVTGKASESSSCTQSVCRNSEEGLVRETEDNLVEVDVSPVVNEIAEIVRAENRVISMEESLENANFHFEPEIIEKVLKRCFKVPKLAIRFFNWLKLKHDFRHTTEIYNTMLYIVGECRDFRLLENLIKEMEENSCQKDIKTWTILISHYGKAKMINKALMAFENMIKSGCESDSASYKTMIRSLCIAGKGELAIEFYKEMIEKEFVLDLSSYKLLLNTIAKTENNNGVLVLHSIANDMVNMVNIHQIPEHKVYGCLLHSFCVAGRIKEAMELIRDLKNKQVSLDPDCFMILVKGLCKADRITDALEIVDIMKKRSSINGKVYEIIINGYLRRNDVSKALELFETMKESNHLPTVSTYTELIQRLFRLDEYKKSCELYKEMLEKGVKPDSVVVTAIVAGHVRRNLVDEAWKVFKSMEDIGIKINWKAYSVFIKELCRVYKTDEIIKVLHLMQASNIVIGDEIFDWVVSCMERKSEVDKILEVKQIQASEFLAQEGNVSKYDSPREEKLHVELRPRPVLVAPPSPPPPPPKSTTFNEHDVRKICSVLRCSEDWCTVQKSLENCSMQFKPDLVVEILKKSIMHGNAALRFFSWVGMQVGYKHTTETYNMAIKLSGRGKDFKHMRKLFHDMRRQGFLITSDTWAIMIMQYGRAGLTDIALRTYREMKVLGGFNPTNATFKCLIMVLCERKHRKADESVKIFQEMVRSGCIPEKKLVEIYLDCLCEVGMMFEAKTCIDLLCKVGFTVSFSYSMYVRALCRAGRLDEALSSLSDNVGNEKSKLDRFTYASIVHGLLQKGRVKDAMDKIDSMKKVGINPTVHVYTSLIVYFFKEKQLRKALEMFEKMCEEGCEPTVVTYSALVCGYMNMGLVDDAWICFDAMKKKGCLPDFKMYSVFIRCLCEAGKSEDGLKLLYEMMDGGIVPSSVNFRTVFYGLNREGKEKLAQTVLREKSFLKSRRQLST